MWDNLNDLIFKLKYVLKICNRFIILGVISFLILVILCLLNLIFK